MVDDNKNHFCYPFKADKVKQIREMTVNNVSKKKRWCSWKNRIGYIRIHLDNWEIKKILWQIFGSSKSG